MPDPSTRKALIRVLYLRSAKGTAKTDEMFDRAWQWLENPHNKSFWADSEIGQCAAKADALLRWVNAAGLEVAWKERDDG